MTRKQILLTGGLSLLLATINYFIEREPNLKYIVKMDVHVGVDK